MYRVKKEDTLEINGYKFQEIFYVFLVKHKSPQK